MTGEPGGQGARRIFCSITLLLQPRSRMPTQCCLAPKPHPHKMSSTRTRNLGGKLQQVAMVAWLVCLHMDTELRGFWEQSVVSSE